MAPKLRSTLRCKVSLTQSTEEPGHSEGSVLCEWGSQRVTPSPEWGWRQVPRKAIPALDLGHTEKQAGGTERQEKGVISKEVGSAVPRVTKGEDTRAMPKGQE